jgi:hypothetical protein
MASSSALEMEKKSSWGPEDAFSGSDEPVARMTNGRSMHGT